MHSTEIHLPNCQLPLIGAERLYPQVGQRMRTWNVTFLPLCFNSLPINVSVSKAHRDTSVMSLYVGCTAQSACMSDSKSGDLHLSRPTLEHRACQEGSAYGSYHLFSTSEDEDTMTVFRCPESWG